MNELNKKRLRHFKVSRFHAIHTSLLSRVSNGLDTAEAKADAPDSGMSRMSCTYMIVIGRSNVVICVLSNLHR